MMMTQDTIILSFDTTSRQDSIALRSSTIDEVRILPQGGSGLQSAILVPELQRLLADYSLTFRDVSLLCTLTGPGSFTGIRIGLATAQGFKIALNIPVFAPSALDILAGLSGYPAVIDSLRQDYFVKDNDQILILTLSELHQRFGNQPIASTSEISDIRTIVNNTPMAKLVTDFYLSHKTYRQYSVLEPFYIRTPEFTKKKPTI